MDAMHDADDLLSRMKDVACEVIDDETKRGKFVSLRQGLDSIEDEFFELRVLAVSAPKQKINYKKIYMQTIRVAARAVKMMQLAKDKGGF